MQEPFSAAAISRLDGQDQDGIHLLWAPPYPAGFSVDGFDIDRLEGALEYEVDCHRLTPEEMQTLHQDHAVSTRLGDVTYRLAACPEEPPPVPDEPVTQAGNAAPLRRGLATLIPPLQPLIERLNLPPSLGLVAPGAAHNPFCWAYSIDFPLTHRYVSVSVESATIFVVALHDGKAVDSAKAGGSGGQFVEFRGDPVDRLLVYVTTPAKSIRVCVDFISPEFLDQQWNGAKSIASNIQLPVRAVHGGLSTPGDEETLATSRLLPGEPFDGNAFQEVAALLNAASEKHQQVSPQWLTTLTRETVDDPFIELRSWSYGLALTMAPAWRRMLGFGFLDRAGQLVPGETYSYRITGRFRRRDVAERLYGFHTVPAGTTLPTQFEMDDIGVFLSAPRTVEFQPSPSGAALQATGRKGIRLRHDPDVNYNLTFHFPTPRTHVVLEIGDSAFHNLMYTAEETGFFPGTPLVVQDAIPLQERVAIDFSFPIDYLKIEGNGFLLGLRLPDDPNAAPDELLERSVYIHNVLLKDTDPPPVPAALGTVNLQEPILPAPPEVSTDNPPRALGFKLLWAAPPRGGVTLWPADLDAVPPTEVLGYRLARRNVTAGGEFNPLDEGDTLYFGNRGRRATVESLAPGIDLAVVFPETFLVTPPVSPFLDAEDVLDVGEGTPIQPGDRLQYRIVSVDAIGRESVTPTVGSVVRLEKHVPPPPPAAPTTAVPPGVVAPSGVRARLIQAGDPQGLAPADATLLGASQNVILLEWSWRAEERTEDPFAREFRVYYRTQPPDRVTGRLVGAATLNGGRYEMTAEMSHSLPTDALAGQFIRAGQATFEVDSHPAGTTFTLRLFPSNLQETAVPQPATFLYTPILDGSEQRPPGWTERVAVIPLTADENYSHVFRDLVTLSAAAPRARLWVGVSAADDQAYIADEVPAGDPNGGRPGNESSIAVVTVEGRYFGQPTFTMPDPLPDVPELLSAEPALADIAVRLDLPALLPALTIPPGHRLRLERLPSNELLQFLQPLADDTIGVTLPDGSSSSYTLANPRDQSDFLAQLRSGEPARIEGRFLTDFLIRFRNALRTAWRPASQREPIPLAPVVDTLPANAERYFYRLRLVDPAGHESSGDALLPLIVRVVSLRTPAAPEVRVRSSDDDTLDVAVTFTDAFDLAWLLLFESTAAAGEPLAADRLEKAQLLRLPNRRDLYPQDGIRLRLLDGTLLAPVAAVDVTTGVSQPPQRRLDLTLTPGFDRRVSLWAALLTRDGINSRFSGPVNALTAPVPLVVPALTAVAAAGNDDLSWGAPAVTPADVAVERSVDGGSQWERVSPWFAHNMTAASLPAVTGPRQYRLVLRASGERTATGAPVSLP